MIIQRIGQLLVAIALLSVGALGQPRWPENTNIRVYVIRGAFNTSEQTRIKIAVESWQVYLPEGLSLRVVGETEQVLDCKGCVTILRAGIKQKNEDGEYIARRWSNSIFTRYGLILIDTDISSDSLASLLAHELGHCLGLGHRANSIMSPIAQGMPTREDGAILRARYGRVLPIESRDNELAVAPRVILPKSQDSQDLVDKLKARTIKNLELLRLTIATQNLKLWGDDEGTKWSQYRIRVSDNGVQSFKKINKDRSLGKEVDRLPTPEQGIVPASEWYELLGGIGWYPAIMFKSQQGGKLVFNYSNSCLWPQRKGSELIEEFAKCSGEIITDSEFNVLAISRTRYLPTGLVARVDKTKIAYGFVKGTLAPLTMKIECQFIDGRWYYAEATWADYNLFRTTVAIKEVD